MSDTVRFDELTAAEAGALAAEDGSTGHELTLGIDGFDRAAIDALPLPTRTSALVESRDPQSFDPETTFTESILPAVFGDAHASDSPTVTMLAGPPGSGFARATNSLRSGIGGGVVSLDSLRAFVPKVVDRASTEHVVGGWLAGTSRHARENRLDLVVAAPFRSPDVTLGLLESFRRAGFSPVLAAVGTSRAESLLATTSLAVRSRERPVMSLSQIADSELGLEDVLRAAEGSDTPARVVVFDRVGTRVFDRARDDGFAGAGDAFAATLRDPMSTLQATQWLSELRRVTEFARLPGVDLRDVFPVLLSLHELALQDVVRRLPISATSPAAQLLEARLVQEVSSLRAEIPSPARRVDSGPTGPTTPVDGPGLSR